MRLRLIMLVLSLLAFMSAAGGGLLYYLSLREAAFQEARAQAATRAASLHQAVAFQLTENVRAARTLAGLGALGRFLDNGQEAELEAVNRLLDHHAAALGVEVCYLIGARGVVLASSNRQTPESFVGQDFGFRPYFREALQENPAVYAALGAATGRRGIYSSHPVYGLSPSQPLGVVVVKASVDRIERSLALPEDEHLLVADSHGIVFISSRPDWLLHATRALSAAEKNELVATRQFGLGPWPLVDLTREGPGGTLAVHGGEVFLATGMPLGTFPGWQMIHLQNRQAVARSLADPFRRIVGPAILLLCFLVSGAVLIFYRMASREIRRRMAAEDSMRVSEARYRFIYHNAPAMLHSIDASGRLVNVSDHWLQALGYAREEVIGQPLTEFMSPASADYARREAIPQFFRKGGATDVPYRLLRKGGEPMDVLLSSIAERDAAGHIVRSLSVSIDVTERRRMEQALEQAKEDLSRYSRDLERQVKQRTQEITSILTYTPSAVSITDVEGRYLLVNPRYEALFGVQREVIRGRRMGDVIPAPLASEFQASDRRVLEMRQPVQVEHEIPQDGQMRTFLSVKFPVYDDAGAISGVGAISTDITPLKQAQEQLRRLSACVITSQEAERAAIARELHDELGQVLTALSMEAAWLLQRIQGAAGAALESLEAMGRLMGEAPSMAAQEPQGTRPAHGRLDGIERLLADLRGESAALRRRLEATTAALRERVEAIGVMIDSTIEEVRGIAIRLRPGILDKLGLADALEWFTAEFERRAGIPCVLERDPLPPLSNLVATAAYRITQESLTNVARHAGASRVEVTLKIVGSALELSILDNGRGFDRARFTEADALGLVGMQERAAIVGGELTIDTQPGRGTRVCFRLPVTGEKAP
jgi:PAS domain S-box-containing protein